MSVLVQGLSSCRWQCCWAGKGEQEETSYYSFCVGAVEIQILTNPPCLELISLANQVQSWQEILFAVLKPFLWG